MKNNSTVGTSPLVFSNNFSIGFLRPHYWPTWLSLAFLFAVNLLPAAWVDAIANILGDLARNINQKRRRIARKNLELVFPDLTNNERKALLRQHFHAQMRSVIHLGMFWWSPTSSLNKRIEVLGKEYIDQSLAKGKAVIVMTSHSVGLEAAVSAITMRYPVSGPFKKMKNPVTNYFLAKGRTRFGTIIYSREAGLRPIIKDVRAGNIMFYLPDEDLGKDRSIFVPFFNVQKATIPVLGRLAKTCNADVLPCISCYDVSQHKYKIHILPALTDFPAEDDVLDATRMNQAIEKTVKLCPAQYFWTLRIFRTRPEGEKRFY